MFVKNNTGLGAQWRILAPTVELTRASLEAQWQKIHLPMQDIQVQSLVQEDHLEKEMATHFSILAWEIPQRSLVGYSPWGCKVLGNPKQLNNNIIELMNIQIEMPEDYP